MTGKYEIEVYNNRVHYFLTVKRNITILQAIPQDQASQGTHTECNPARYEQRANRGYQ